MNGDLASQFQQANELANLGRDAQALELLLRLLRAHPEASGSIEFLIARTHLVAGRPEEGRQHALRGITVTPNAYLGHLLLGIALHMLGRPAEAIEPLQRATELDLEDADGPQRLAQALADVGRVPEAYAAATEALRRDPHDSANHFTMGFVLRDSNPTESERAYRKALELDPENHAAKHNLAGAAVRRGDWAAGSKGMASVLASNPQAGTPVFVLDLRVVDVIRWLHWLLLGGTFGYGMATAQHPIAAVGWVFALLGPAVVLIHRGTAPIRAALPEGGGRFFAGFPRRERIAAVWGGLLALAWLWLAGWAIAGAIGDPERSWAGLGAFGFLLVGWILSWIRVPLVKAKAQRLRHGRTEADQP
ncbi:MAG: tetratricopeptide repeat protein [Propionibacteriaceae bacterium]|nr:tetratricopeptide repeat protein [Propionibacteriaceae bacterium]